MAKAAVVEYPSGPFQFDKAPAQMPKRKTPSELREEQLKRRGSELASELVVNSSNTSDRLITDHGVKRSEPLKKPKYIDTRVNDVFPVIKSCRSRFGLEKCKEAIRLHNPDPSGTSSGPNKSSDDDQASLPVGSIYILRTNSSQSSRKVDKCSEITFRNVAELSQGKDASASAPTIDMDKAFRGLVARDILPAPSMDSAELSNNSSSISSKGSCNEFTLLGNKIPLDFTLKTTLRMVSSSPIKWIHRLVSRGSYSASHGSSCSSVSSDQTTCKEALLSKAFQSWRYPQSCLPSSIVLAMSLSTANAEMDFLKKRQQDWEDSFTNLYYMFRQNKCRIFYVCTSQFVVLFVNCLSAKKTSCSAYVSRSTLGLRSLLTEHDVHFSMPLCKVKVEHATADDLVELSAIGQTLHLDSDSNVDNSPQSLLAFIGNENVHALYDFLLNYRSFLASLSSFDVPLLYSPLPFQNASISYPEVRCKEIKRADKSYGGYRPNEMESSCDMTSNSFCYSLDVKDEIIPPWVVSGTCAAMTSMGIHFEMSFTDDAKSSGLNTTLNSVIKPDLQEDQPDDSVAVIMEAVPQSWLKNASLRSLKYNGDSYKASITWVR